MSLLDRFLRYVRIETTAVEATSSYPSSPGQLELGRVLLSELVALGAANAQQSPFGIVTARIPATVSGPTIAFFAHVDTTPEYTAKGITPVVHRDWDGSDIVLESGDVIGADEIGSERKGQTIVTTTGSTLLGGDDKCGVAVMMEATERLLKDQTIPHPEIVMCFTCDEEIGRGTDHIDIKAIGAVAGYTLDGKGVGTITTETFSADLATVTVRGVNTHPSDGKGRMVNAIRIMSRFLAALPVDELSPESTEGREGFLHPYRLEGGVEEASVKILLRDFDTPKLRDYEQLLRDTAARVSDRIEVVVTEQYRNLADGLKADSRSLDKAVQAIKAAGLEPTFDIARGGTDGSRLTEKGLPTPNLSTGEHHIHSPLEWTCVEDMETAVTVVIELAKAWRS